MSSVNQFPATRTSYLKDNLDNINVPVANQYGYFFRLTGTKVAFLDPLRDLYGNYSYIFNINRRNYKIAYSSAAPLQVSLAATGVGGLVDGITFTNGRQYLLWAFADQANNNYGGLIATRKPFSTWTTFTGSGALGSTNFVITNVTNGYQFTIGARIVVRNTAGTAPLFQYNWGTITAQTNTSLSITLDNNANYGVPITLGTGGEVKQWDSFYPWVVTSTGQTLYADNYVLLGEAYTDSTTGNIHNAYRVDDEYRTGMRKVARDQTTAVAASTAFTFARDIPLWADKINAQLFIDANNPSVSLTLLNHNSTDIVAFLVSLNPAFTLAGFIANTGYIDLDPYASLQWLKNNTVRGVVWVLDFRVKGGMRL